MIHNAIDLEPIAIKSWQTPHRWHEAPELWPLLAAVGLGGGSENKALSEAQVAETSEAMRVFQILRALRLGVNLEVEESEPLSTLEFRIA